MLYSDISAYLIILATAVTLDVAGITNINPAVITGPAVVRTVIPG